MIHDPYEWIDPEVGRQGYVNTPPGYLENWTPPPQPHQLSPGRTPHYVNIRFDDPLREAAKRALLQAAGRRSVDDVRARLVEKFDGAKCLRDIPDERLQDVIREFTSPHWT